MADLVRTMLPSGQEVWVQVQPTEQYRDTGGDGRKLLDLEGFTEAIHGLAASIQLSLAGLRPSQVTAEFGFELTVKAGKLVTAIVDAGGKAAVKVTLRWDKADHTGAAGEQDEPKPDPKPEGEL
jgi:NTP-dependent ternary system trypsin peptidase co-occuring protein